MAGISTLPSAEASAAAEPDSPEKIIEAITEVSARPPLKRPTIDIARSMMRVVIPPRFIRFPARMRNGMASSA